MRFEAVLLAYCVVVLLGRFLGGRSSAAPWELALSVAVGIVWALVGPGREYTGAAAYFQSVLCVLFGAGFIGVSLFFPRFWQR